MRFAQWLQQYAFLQQALVAGVAVATACALLSVVVVLKRMAFIGQGISHAAFGGVGTAALLGLAGFGQDLVVFAFCLGTALLIGLLSRRGLAADSAIGILLAGAMAWGAMCDQLSVALSERAWYVELFGPRGYRPGFEAVLFGSLLSVSATRMWLAIGLCAAVLACGAALFKEIVFFTFDETVSKVFGVPTGFIYYLLLILLAVTVVLSMLLVGVVLVTALLVVPGATALQLSRRLGPVLIWSWLAGLAGMVGGLILSIEAGQLPTGPCVVLVLCLLFAAAWSWRTGRRRWATAPSR